MAPSRRRSTQASSPAAPCTSACATVCRSCWADRCATTARSPTTMANVVEAADAMREHVGGVAVALMLASTLHAIATGNLLPAGVETFCVDINQAVVTKLADRGSHQALGIVTDVGPFVHQLSEALANERAGVGPALPHVPALHFGVLYEINPWMHARVAVDRDPQHRTMGEPRHQPARRRSRDRNAHPAGARSRSRVHRQRRAGRRFDLRAEHFRHPSVNRRRRSSRSGSLSRVGAVVDLPEEIGHEGAGDALPFDGTLLSGYRPRSDVAAGPVISEKLGVPVRTIELVDDRLFHVDLTFARSTTGGRCVHDGLGRLRPQSRRRARARTAMARRRRGVVVLCELGRGRHQHRDAVTPARVGRQLEAWGFSVVESPVDEFLKGGRRLSLPDARVGREVELRSRARSTPWRARCAPP